MQSRYVASLSPLALVGELARTLGAVPKGASAESVPFLQRELVFPYAAGQEFVRALRARGGQRLLDRAFRHPPRTTAAVLDPARYLAGDPPPQAVRLPAASYRFATSFGAQDLVALTGERRLARGWLGGRLGVGRAGPRPAPRDARRGLCGRRARGASCPRRQRSRSAAGSSASGSRTTRLQDGRLPADRDAVEPSPVRGEAESAAERRLHAVVDTLGLHVYSGETHPDDRFVTTVALTPSRSLLGLAPEATGTDEQWLAAIHPDDRVRYEELFCYANERLLHPLELEYRLRGYDGVERWVWERIFPHRLRDDGVVDLDGVVADVTALHEATNERNDLSQRLERVLGGVAEFVVSCELRDGRTIWMHRGPGVERMLGGPLPEGADGPTVWYDCVHPDDRPRPRRLLRAAGAARAGRCDLSPARPRRGRALGLGARPPASGDGPVVAYDAVISDVTERERARIGLQLAREEAERRSRVDPTTGLFNRHHLLDVARRELARSQRENTSPALVLLDVDRLRELNERRGHAIGDAVLRELAGRLSHSVRTYDTISHVGGGRFAVLVPDLRDGEALRRICDEIAATMTGEPLRSAGREVHVTVSAGGARAHPGTTVDALLHTAEVALATAKRTSAEQPTVQEARRESAADESGEAVRVAATLARAAAVREGVPHEHECSVAELAELVGRELGLPETLQGDLRLAGLLHDVGTIAVAGAVLSKPGPLDEEEWVMLREHPSIGADMVARIPGLARTQLAIRHHHERYDGQGYPDRLAGEAIPMAARVLAAVDAYTAMTEIRPYRDARERNEALEELRRNAGTQLDPAVVDALCRVLAGESAGALAA